MFAWITDKDGLKALAETSKGRNREADPYWIEEWIDPDGTNVLTWSMVHEHIRGEKVQPHLRCHWMAKTLPECPEATTDSNGLTSVSLHMDVDMDAMNLFTVQSPRLDKSR